MEIQKFGVSSADSDLHDGEVSRVEHVNVPCTQTGT